MGRASINLKGVFYSCKHCNTSLAHVNEFILEESFRGRHGRTYLFNKVGNVTFGEEEEGEMMGGLHTVDIFCVKCGSNVGWKLLSAQQQTEQYKVGKFILKSSPLNQKETHIKRIAALPGEWFGAHRNYDVLKVPEGHCWVEGDNAASILDSNSFGAAAPSFGHVEDS